MAALGDTPGGVSPSYHGATGGRQLWDYCGYDRDSFADLYESWLEVTIEELEEEVP